MLKSIHITCPSSRYGVCSHQGNTGTSPAGPGEVAEYESSLCIAAGAKLSLEIAGLSCQLMIALVSSLEFREV